MRFECNVIDSFFLDRSGFNCLHGHLQRHLLSGTFEVLMTVIFKLMLFGRNIANFSLGEHESYWKQRQKPHYNRFTLYTDSFPFSALQRHLLNDNFKIPKTVIFKNFLI